MGNSPTQSQKGKAQVMSKRILLALSVALLTISGSGCAYMHMHDATSFRFCQTVAQLVEAEEAKERAKDRDHEFHRYLELTRSRSAAMK